MDITGGKGIMLGQSNFLARAYQGAPIAITVEGANILTRSMMIFGRGDSLPSVRAGRDGSGEEQ